MAPNQLFAERIQHIIYIVKENRTFDQILGDLGNGSNGDPSLTLFGRRVTPSFHLMAQNFVTLDNFMDPGDGSMDGWSWSMRGRVTCGSSVKSQVSRVTLKMRPSDCVVVIAVLCPRKRSSEVAIPIPNFAPTHNASGAAWTQFESPIAPLCPC